MTRAEAIAIIEKGLAEADDDTIERAAELFRGAGVGSVLGRQLSDREKALIERSKADFAAGQTVTLEESRARTDALFARHRAANKAAE